MAIYLISKIIFCRRQVVVACFYYILNYERMN
nr:MAG TPA: hypothetical protein [Caudoviricetes sp.]